MRNVRMKVGAGGRIVLPAEFRKELGLAPGDEVLVVLDNGALRILTPRQALEEAQAVVRRYLPNGKSLAAELIEERRKEAKRE